MHRPNGPNVLNSVPLIDRGAESVESHLLKLLTVLVVQQGGEVRIPIQDLYGINPAEGVVKTWDPKTKEIVLRYAPEHTEAYFLASPASPTVPGQPSVPMSYQDSLALRVVDPSPLAPPRNLVEVPPPAQEESPTWAARRAAKLVHQLLDDSKLASLEKQRKQDALIRQATSPEEMRPTRTTKLTGFEK